MVTSGSDDISLQRKLREFGGLYIDLSEAYQTYQTMVDKRFRCAKAIIGLEEEVNALHQKIKETKEAQKQEIKPEKIKGINETVISYMLDLERHEMMKINLIDNLFDYNEEILGYDGIIKLFP